MNRPFLPDSEQPEEAGSQPSWSWLASGKAFHSSSVLPIECLFLQAGVSLVDGVSLVEDVEDEASRSSRSQTT